ncbi:MAG: ribosomal protein S6--L-glutamate ligase, partial [Bermanella sp.]
MQLFGGNKVTEYTIGMWMYQNGGGEAIQHQIIEQLNEREIQVFNELYLQYATAGNGHITCNGVNMENLDLYFSYNVGQQTVYQKYLYQMLNYSVPCVNSFDAFALTEDKFKTSHLLNHHGIATAQYQLCHREDLKSAKEIMKSWGGQAVFKPIDGWGGNGIEKLENIADLDKFITVLERQNKYYFYLEKFIDHD